MFCYIYRSNKKTGAYLYLAEKDNFDQLPDGILQAFGPPEFSMSINLTAEKKLAQADATQVLDKLESEGFYLQLPRTDYNPQRIEEQIIQSLQSREGE